MSDDNPFASSPNTFSNKIMRVLWKLGWILLFRPTPKLFYAWRRMILRMFGAKVGVGAQVLPSVIISEPWKLEVGQYVCIGEGVNCYCGGGLCLEDFVTVSQFSHICTLTHDYEDFRAPLVRRPVVIKKQAWVCADSFIAPGVTVGNGAVVGARSVVVRDVNEWSIVAGNPAKFIKPRKINKRL
ncbi:hypothetical protein P4C99_07985 [Pontiellaceae bacterium B1224]|nr:hypothetical protein [Pontiellaceae bacterium B1224]